MIPFKWHRRDARGVPIIRNRDIWTYAEALVGDYRPQLLRTPGALNVEHFLESYLGATIDYQDLYFGEDEDPIAGATVFHDDLIRVFDRDGMCVRLIPVAANTIIIDNETVRRGNKGFEAFTGLHEGGHFAMHGEVFRKDPGRPSFFGSPEDKGGVQCCRAAEIVRLQGQKRPREKWRVFLEQQANSFAAFAAMPRQTFIPCAKRLIREAGFPEGLLPVEDRDWELYEAKQNLCHQLSELYGMSRTAVKVHLYALNLLIPWEDYVLMTHRTTIAL